MAQGRAEVKVWHIYHSGFAVETARHLLIFDYYRDSGSAPGLADRLVGGALDRHVIVLASHGHGDHYSPGIFGWAGRHPKVSFVLADDIDPPGLAIPVVSAGPGESFAVGDVRVRTLRSTDLGVAFLVKCDGLCIYHAGDLNWWHWQGEPDEDNEAMAAAYKAEIDLLAGEQIDLAFVPVDPRLNEQYSRGLQYFLDRVRVQTVFPMHFAVGAPVRQWLERDLPPEQFAKIAFASSGPEAVTCTF